MISFKDALSSSFFNDFHRWPLWIPVFFGMGIAFYFHLSFEPSYWWAWGGIGFFLFALLVCRLQLLRLTLLAVSLVGLGFSITLLRTQTLDTTMLQYALPPL